jgi:hypothetical protein
MTTDDPPTPVPAPPPVTNGAAAPKQKKSTSDSDGGDVNWYLPAVFGLVVGALVVCSKRDKKERRDEKEEEERVYIKSDGSRFVTNGAPNGGVAKKGFRFK